jgi:cytochrome b6-f complex iron-sulfur subunit
MDRKDFIKTSCALCGLGVIGAISFLESCKKKNESPAGPTVNFTLDLTSPANAALNTVGGSVHQSGVVVACISAGSFVALAETCTHNGCTVGYNSSGSNFTCPCHGGVFDTNGKVVSGPPPTPLKKYTVSQSGNILTVSG